MGDIVAAELRGGWLGNRGILHEGTEIVRFHAGNLWSTCRLHYKDWRLPQWEKGHLTVLFFHDEAVSYAAGHRHCALCRREDYNEFRRAWAGGNGLHLPSAKDIDRRLHSERIVAGTHDRRLHDMRWRALPPGTFVSLHGSPALVLADRIVPWTRAGYGVPLDRPTAGSAAVVTPPSTVAAFRAGLLPQIDGSALTG